MSCWSSLCYCAVPLCFAHSARVSSCLKLNWLSLCKHCFSLTVQQVLLHALGAHQLLPIYNKWMGRGLFLWKAKMQWAIAIDNIAAPVSKYLSYCNNLVTGHLQYLHVALLSDQLRWAFLAGEQLSYLHPLTNLARLWLNGSYSIFEWSSVMTSGKTLKRLMTLMLLHTSGGCTQAISRNRGKCDLLSLPGIS